MPTVCRRKRGAEVQGADPLRGEHSECAGDAAIEADARAGVRGVEDANGALDEREHSRLHSASSCSVWGVAA